MPHHPAGGWSPRHPCVPAAAGRQPQTDVLLTVSHKVEGFVKMQRRQLVLRLQEPWHCHTAAVPAATHVRARPCPEAQLVATEIFMERAPT